MRPVSLPPPPPHPLGWETGRRDRRWRRWLRQDSASAARGTEPSGAGFFPPWVGVGLANPQVRLQLPCPVPKDLAPTSISSVPPIPEANVKHVSVPTGPRVSVVAENGASEKGGMRGGSVWGEAGTEPAGTQGRWGQKGRHLWEERCSRAVVCFTTFQSTHTWVFIGTVAFRRVSADVHGVGKVVTLCPWSLLLSPHSCSHHPLNLGVAN